MYYRLIIHKQYLYIYKKYNNIYNRTKLYSKNYSIMFLFIFGLILYYIILALFIFVLYN